jgi:hypothetical protein
MPPQLELFLIGAFIIWLLKTGKAEAIVKVIKEA